jgi:molybdopterin-guanine dinucleotide biosynthesis protein A
VTFGHPFELSPGPEDLLGVVLAGGESRRFGREKALSNLGGKPMARWALEAMETWTGDQVVIANDDGVARTLGVSGRPDLMPGQGPIGGLLTGLSWAGEKGMSGIFLMACDLPLVPAALVGRILKAWPTGAGAVVPGSPGPRGLEPLCGGYSVAGAPTVRALLDSGNRFMVDALDALSAHRIPPDELGEAEALTLAFTNVNTVETARIADEALRARGEERG